MHRTVVLSVRLQHSWPGFNICRRICSRRGIDLLGCNSLASFASVIKSPQRQEQPGWFWTLPTRGNRRLLSCDSISTSQSTAAMEASVLLPPATVCGMTTLDKTAFQKKILVPCVTVKSSKVMSAVKSVKKYMLKMLKIQPVQAADDNDSEKEILLNPTLVRDAEDIKKAFADSSEDITYFHKEITVGYDNWKADDVLKAVLPADQQGGLSYSIVGHILHLNLREHLLPYKSLIGEVYLDKVPNISMVVNKLDIIDSTYRNFQMEVLAGSGGTVVTAKENGFSYELDFARVYWNPRLSTEHERVVEQLRQGDVLYDVMAGVGPFAIPAGKKKCHVLANDLNPDSFDALVKNCVRNKVEGRVKCYNQDGHCFIRTTLREDLLKRWRDPDFIGAVHVAMNLPALAVTFLSSFRGLVHRVKEVPEGVQLPVIHVYMFTKETAEDVAIAQVAENLGYPSKPSDTTESCESLQNDVSKSEVKSKSHKSYENLKEYVKEVVHVRKVAPSKAMMRVTFKLPLEVLLEEMIEETQNNKELLSNNEPPTSKEPLNNEEPVCKKLKSS